MLTVFLPQEQLPILTHALDRELEPLPSTTSHVVAVNPPSLTAPVMAMESSGHAHMLMMLLWHAWKVCVYTCALYV